MRHRVAYPGPEDSSPHQALMRVRPRDEHIAYPGIGAVFAAVAAGAVEFGFVPIENVVHGRVAQTLDNLLQYGNRLQICDAAIQPSGGQAEGQDRTRYILLGREGAAPSAHDVTSLIVYPQRDRVRLLYDLLEVISVRHNLNMTDIDRRPDKKGLSIFYIDIEGHARDPNVQGCIAEIATVLADTVVVNLGSYPYRPFNAPLIKTIGIIGGTGEMGRFFIPFFTRLGYEVIAAGRQTEIAPADCARRAEAVIVNVPIEHTAAVIGEIGPLLHAGQLLIDNTGVKTLPVKAMLACTAPEVEVLSIHTMFGPATERLQGQNVIVVPTERSGPMAQEFEDILFKHGAHITRATPEQHDMYVTFTQGLEHMDGVAKLAAILELVDDPQRLASFSTPNSRGTAEICARIHTGDARLYATMLKENPFVLKTLEAYLHHFQEMVDALKQGRTAVFEDKMSANAARLKKG